MILAYDADWQYPAITEQHAFHQASKYLPDCDSAVYVAFPWATLFDAEARGAAHLNHLTQELVQLKQNVPPGCRVVTVCQHIDLLKHLHFMVDFGISDVFWSHATDKGQNLLDSGIRVWPFPLYPVQRVEALPFSQRDIQFSFVGATSNQWYLTQSRAWIGELLSEDFGGVVLLRDKWHFNKVVYDHQIHRKTADDAGLINATASDEYRDILARSRFALCPSGTGPNSIRLWECVHADIVPVILSDTYVPPGNADLWTQAAVYCPENREAIAALPSRLSELEADPEGMQKRMHALAQLRFCYGVDCFVYDLIEFFSNPDAWMHESTVTSNTQPLFFSLSDNQIPVFSAGDTERCRLYYQSLATSVLLSPEETLTHLYEMDSDSLEDGLAEFMSTLSEADKQVYRRIFSDFPVRQLVE